MNRDEIHATIETAKAGRSAPDTDGSHSQIAEILLRTTLDMLARLEDAEAAQALVVERAAERMDCVSFDPPDHWDAATQNEFHKIIVDECLAWQRAIRALADPSGVAALAALRARERESAMQALASIGQAQEAYEAQLKAEAERDDALTRLAAAEARVGALTSLLERAVVRVPPAFHSLRAEIRAALASAAGGAK